MDRSIRLGPYVATASTSSQTNRSCSVPIHRLGPSLHNSLTPPVGLSIDCGTPSHGLSHRKSPFAAPIQRLRPSHFRMETRPTGTSTFVGIPVCVSSHLYRPFGVPIHSVL